MTANRTVPCNPYVTHEELLACCSNVAEGATEEDTLISRQLASEFMFYRTAMQYPGTCTETIRPCYACSPCSDDGPPYEATIIDGRMYNIRCTGNACNCEDKCEIRLPDSPVASVDEVKIDGVVLDPAAYGLYNDVLARVDGGCWPYCNELYLATTEEGTWSVTYTFGYEAPQLIKTAAAVLACHWQDMCSDSDSCNACRIPKNATTMNRAGTTYQLLTPAAMQTFTGNALLVGITEVDYAIQTFNPKGFRRMARIYG